MPKLLTFGLVALGATLASCGGGSTSANNSAEAAPENVQNRVAEMPEGERNAVFIRAIQDANQPCQHVARSRLSGESDGLPIWTAECDGGESYSIAIGNDGQATVIVQPPVGPIANQAADGQVR